MTNYTIFGESGFLDGSMIQIAGMHEQEILKEILKEIYKTTFKIGVKIDEEKLKKWIELCFKLENIDQTELIDFASRKKFAEKDQQLKQQDTEILLLKKALMIATKRANRLNNHCDKLKGIYNAKFPYSDEVEYECAIKIAKKELNILEESNK